MSRPNLLLFNPDQWRGDVLGHRGNPAAMTPNIDASVASDAVSFVNTFAQATVCTPSRCSFMTGWYPHVFGHRTMHHMLHGPEAEANLLRVLRRNGYFVWWGGKNDLIPGPTRGLRALGLLAAGRLPRWRSRLARRSGWRQLLQFLQRQTRRGRG